MKNKPTLEEIKWILIQKIENLVPDHMITCIERFVESCMDEPKGRFGFGYDRTGIYVFALDNGEEKNKKYLSNNCTCETRKKMNKKLHTHQRDLTIEVITEVSLLLDKCNLLTPQEIINLKEFYDRQIELLKELEDED